MVSGATLLVELISVDASELLRAAFAAMTIPITCGAREGGSKDHHVANAPVAASVIFQEDQKRLANIGFRDAEASMFLSGARNANVDIVMRITIPTTLVVASAVAQIFIQLGSALVAEESGRIMRRYGNLSKNGACCVGQ